MHIKCKYVCNIMETGQWFKFTHDGDLDVYIFLNDGASSLAACAFTSYQGLMGG